MARKAPEFLKDAIQARVLFKTTAQPKLVGSPEVK